MRRTPRPTSSTWVLVSLDHCCQAFAIADVSLQHWSVFPTLLGTSSLCTPVLTTAYRIDVPLGLPLSCLSTTVRRIREPSVPPCGSKLTSQRDENGKPWVLESVLKAEDILHEQRRNKEYLPITVSCCASARSSRD